MTQIQNQKSILYIGNSEENKELLDIEELNNNILFYSKNINIESINHITEQLTRIGIPTLIITNRPEEFKEIPVYLEEISSIVGTKKIKYTKNNKTLILERINKEYSDLNNLNRLVLVFDQINNFHIEEIEKEIFSTNKISSSISVIAFSESLPCQILNKNIGYQFEINL